MTKQEKPRRNSLPLGRTWAPSFAKLTGDRLIEAHRNPKVMRPSPALLQQFIRIAEAADADAAVTRFARKWGLVGLCKHGLPSQHNFDCLCKQEDSVSAYHRFARTLEAVLCVGLELSAGRPGEDTDWELLAQGLSSKDFPVWPPVFRKRIQDARTCFRGLIDRLILISGLIPQLCWKGDSWSVDFGCLRGSNLAAVMTLQIMAEIGGRAMRKCQNCPRWFIPKGRQIYCSSPTCGKRAGQRAASKSYRGKKQLLKVMRDVQEKLRS